MVETYSGWKSDLKLSDIMSQKETTYSDKHIHHLIEGTYELDNLTIPIISKKLFLRDRIGNLMVRLGINRMDYSFPPGLYLIGEYDENLPVIVSCNYKLTLDALRNEMKRTGYWLLILDTKGVNVWCAAGKGTFGTEELIFQLTKWEIKNKLNAKLVILPQLGASRMTPHIIKNLTGVNAIYGPVRSEDLDEFIEQKHKIEDEKRTVQFKFKDRIVLTPIEFVSQLKYMILFFVLMGIWNAVSSGFLPAFAPTVMLTMPWFIMMFMGTVIFPIALPILTPKFFSLKGMLLSVPAIILILINRHWFALGNDPLQLIAWSIGYFIYIGYLALNFTGSTTFTSFSGVTYEVKHFKRISKIVGVIAVGMLILSLML